MIGTLGPVTFSVSDKRIRTFNDLKLSHSARYAEHAIIGKRGLLEFVGFGVDSVSMTIKIGLELGLKPYEELRTLRKMYRDRAAFDFVLDGKPVGENLWIIEGFDEELESFTIDGKLRSALINIKLKEYVTIDEEK